MSMREEIRIGKDSGRVKVFARVRPLNKDETNKKTGYALQVSEENCQINVYDSKKKFEKTYQFDHVFSSSQTNEKICERLSKPMVNSALEGFNGTLMAYGQTGTGKTHTLMAPDGLTHDIINKVFERTKNDVSHDFKVTASYLQIYQEKIHDLLNINNKVELNIRESPKLGIYVENLTEYVVRSPADALSLIAFGRRRLVFAETKMNRTSSRSHSVFQMTIEKAPKKEKSPNETAGNKDGKKMKNCQENNDEDVVQLIGLGNDVIVRGKIHLCDLAGSERVKKTLAAGERLSEAQCINSSLLELGNVIQALADNKKTHVPFRNSVLTRLLQESLGGNCKTSLIVCVSPSITDVSETKSTLNFGSRAMKITNTAYVNMEVDFKRLSDSLLLKLEEKETELQQLRNEQNSLSALQSKELLSKIDVIAEESKNAIQSMKLLHEDQVTEFQDEIRKLTNEISDKDEQINKLNNELESMKRQRNKENEFAKALLVSEMASLEMLVAEETLEIMRQNSESGMKDQRKLVTELLGHCENLLKYSSVFLGNSMSSKKEIFSKDRNSSTKGLNGSVLFNGLAEDLMELNNGENALSDEVDFGNLESNLLSTKRKIDKLLSETFQHGKAHSCIGTDDCDSQISPMADLCKVLIDKAFLACHVVIENRELKTKVTRLLNTQTQNKKYTIEEDFIEIISEKFKKVTVDHADVEERCSGFENALSKIENILALKSEKDSPSKKEIAKSRKENEDMLSKRRTFNRQDTFTISKSVETQTDFGQAVFGEENAFEGTRQTLRPRSLRGCTSNENEAVRKGLLHGESSRGFKLIESEADKKGIPLAEPLKDHRSNQNEAEKIEVVQELSPLEINFFEDDDSSLINLFSETQDMLKIIDDCMKLDAEISNVKSKIKENSLKKIRSVNTASDKDVSSDNNIDAKLSSVSRVKERPKIPSSTKDSKNPVLKANTDGDIRSNGLSFENSIDYTLQDAFSFVESGHDKLDAANSLNKQQIEIASLEKKISLLEQENQQLNKRLNEIEAANKTSASSKSCTCPVRHNMGIFNPLQSLNGSLLSKLDFYDNDCFSVSLPVFHRPSCLCLCNGLHVNGIGHMFFHGNACKPLWNLGQLKKDVYRTPKQLKSYQNQTDSLLCNISVIPCQFFPDELNLSSKTNQTKIDLSCADVSNVHAQYYSSGVTENDLEGELSPPNSSKDSDSSFVDIGESKMEKSFDVFVEERKLPSSVRGVDFTRGGEDDREFRNISEVEEKCLASKLKEAQREERRDRLKPLESAVSADSEKESNLSDSELTDPELPDSDEELDRKLQVYNLDYEEKDLCEPELRSRCNVKQNYESENLTEMKSNRFCKPDPILNSENAKLEVKIGSNNDQLVYGDSFTSPLIKQDSFQFEAEYCENESRDSDEQLYDKNDVKCLDLELTNQTEDVVVKKSWSISNWFWPKHQKKNQIEEVSVVIQ